jgi:predicted PurR-regulated permease PerM
VVPAQAKSAGRFSVAELTSQGLDEGVSYVKRNAFELVLIGHRVIQKIARSIFLLFMTLMVAGYIMQTREAIVGFFRSLVPPRSRIGFDRLLVRLDRGLSGVVRGQLLICLVNGVLSAIGFALFGLKYWPILAIVAGIMSIVPIFGSITSAIPAVLIGLTQGLWTALSVLIWIIGIHQIEANLLNPKIIGTAAKIHPVLVVLALIVGEHFFGLWGALLGVPALSLLQSIFNHFRFETMPDAPPDSLLPPVGATRR